MAAKELSSRYRHAFITGASGGLGLAFAKMLLAEGIRVTGTARDVARLASLAKDTRFTPLALDLADAPGAERAFREAEVAAGEGGFDLVINNAGYGLFGAFTEVDFSVWQAQVDALLSATARLSHVGLRSMLPRKRGTLVNVSSLAVEFPLPFMSGYNMAKAALSALSESLIFETRGTGVTVIDLRPGDYRTAFNQAMQPTVHLSASDPRLASAWRELESHLATAPLAVAAARDLRRALMRGRSGTVRSGSFFQARIAPLFSRLAPARVRRAIIARYQGAS
ncbi:short-chain dehydrogenase [Nibricoccus aquaticus]|uniref:Short-chain dehydrogenase n=1 Tax=Nibricoccus aquaticus TaxID=2576891 RepID=A0A290Q9J4_9BACT|nr:SDR family NAD(P)-dependent oxidoreductase [Nibricoccus aquaticus]ATC64927.1 short-chain dehydrogenase [Nibricoccus aquaticus]